MPIWNVAAPCVHTLSSAIVSIQTNSDPNNVRSFSDDLFSLIHQATAYPLPSKVWKHIELFDFQEYLLCERVDNLITT